MALEVVSAATLVRIRIPAKFVDNGIDPDDLQMAPIFRT